MKLNKNFTYQSFWNAFLKIILNEHKQENIFQVFSKICFSAAINKVVFVTIFFNLPDCLTMTLILEHPVFYFFNFAHWSNRGGWRKYPTSGAPTPSRAKMRQKERVKDHEWGALWVGRGTEAYRNNGPQWTPFYSKNKITRGEG